MIVYYLLWDGPPSGRNYTTKQIGRYKGDVLIETPWGVILTAEKKALHKVLMLDDSVTPPQIVRNDFGKRKPTWKELNAGAKHDETFWFFFDRENLEFPDIYANEKGDIMNRDGELVMKGPAS
jgi:hypothetical protein